ncbi:PDZ and LIM domain protein 7 [Lepeophtheirus salmonis]|uniref:PDZ and LIM domain protein 7 n=1 Tax=Lepeophtheirus salmonis TaxID=72036 RepID=UPI001AE16F83|nr:PDZ and LIM domain protein 7-like [Lepeophtheirus salmonis]
MSNEDAPSVCYKCNLNIEGRAMKAKDYLYHDDEKCFSCEKCNCDLRKVSVYSKDGKLYCEKNYKEEFIPKCAHCMEYIIENCVRAMDKTWHAHHFSCYDCMKTFTPDMGYHEFEGRPYCEPCYTKTALPKCKGCSSAITDKAMKALGGQWHIKCFVCKDCKTTFEGQKSFYSVEDKPICGACAGMEGK